MHAHEKHFNKKYLLELIPFKTQNSIFYLRIFAITAVGSVFAGYLLATALYSPDMLWGLDVGGSLTVRHLK